MAEYHVKWEIDVEAGSPKQAAKKALKIQRDPESIATVFEVYKRPKKLTKAQMRHGLKTTTVDLQGWN
jgi:hypothetical protein